MKIIKKRISNGLTVLYYKTKSDIITANLTIRVGSDNEEEDVLGISHLIEHLVFEGTKNRSCLELSNEIESRGGEMNAYTSNDKTSYYIKIDKKHIEKTFDVLSDIILNPTFLDKAIKKEKNVVLEEIKMVNDDPRQSQWIFHIKKLLDKPYNNPPYGSVETVKSLTRKKILKHYHRHYTPDNMIITIVGDCDNWEDYIQKYFVSTRDTDSNIRIKKIEYSQKAKFIEVGSNIGSFSIQKESLSHVYMVIGYRTPVRLSRESIVLDVIWASLARGQSGRLFDEIRTKRGLTYDLGIIHNPGTTYGIFAFYSSASEEKIKEIELIFFKEIRKLKNITDKEIQDAKSFINGNFTLKKEDSHYIADLISFYEECGNYRSFINYNKEIATVSKKEILDCLDRYLLNNKFVKTTILPKIKSKSEIKSS